MRFWRSKKGISLVAAVVAVAAMAVGAYAYFSAAGAGTGTFSSGQIGSVTLSSALVGPIYPQTNAANTTPITVSMTNNGSGSQYVGALSGSVAPVKPSGWL